MQIRVRLAVDRTAPPGGEVLFQDVFLPLPRRWPAQVGSLALHILLVVSVPQLFDWAARLTPADSEWNRYEVQPLRLRVPLYFEAISPPQKEARTAKVQPASVSKPAPRSAASPERAAAQVGHRAVPPGIELPHSPARKNPETVILQPEPPRPDLRVTQVPPLAFWARVPVPPRPVPKPFVTPGRTEVAASPPLLDAPPTLALSNQQLRLADINVASVPPVEKPALPLPASSTAPVRITRTFKPPQTSPAGSIDAGQGEAANVIALGPPPALRSEIVSVPRLSQLPSYATGSGPLNIEPPAARNDRHDAQTAATGAPDAARAARGATGAGNPRGEAVHKTVGRSESAGEGKPHTAATENPQEHRQVSASGVTASSSPGVAPKAERIPLATVQPAPEAPRNAGGIAIGSGQAPASPVQQALLAGAPPPNSSTGPPSVRLERPKDGHFSFVATGYDDTYPEARGSLSGKIIYTVSIRAGTRRDWVLQYCLPASAEHNLGLRASSVALEAPYPFLIVRPVTALELDSKRLIIHGFVNASGRFEQLSLVGDTEFPQKQSLFACLEQWEFRPASRDGQQTTVEVLLIIPREAV